MATLKCEACGAPLSLEKGCKITICKYCGTQTVIEQAEPKYVSIEKTVSTPPQDNSLILSIPSCGSTVFQKKTFNIYRRYAELVDVKTGQVDQHIDFLKVVRYHSILGPNIIFKMSNGQKIMIKCLWDSKVIMALNALNGLI